MSCFSEIPKKVKVIGGIVLVVVFIISLLIGISFQYLDYHEMGFKRQKSSGSVDLTKVYTYGRYFVGPDYEFKTFKADSHFVDLNKVAIFTSDKLELEIDVNFQYKVRSDELTLLHDKYDVSYKGVMNTSALDAIKGAAPYYNTREYINNRSMIEADLFKAIRERLGGKCCRPDCSSYDYACPTGCIARSSCQTSDKGIFVDVEHFQLGYVDIPSDVESQYLTALTLQADAERELLLQEASVIRKNTSAMVKQLQNEAQEITAQGSATAALITATARANYTNILETARADGLKAAFATLGFTTQEYKNSFDYLRTLNNLDHAHLTVDFQQRIVGKVN